MMRKTKTGNPWRAWLEFLATPTTRLSVQLAGLPGHLRLPDGWRTEGVVEAAHLFYLVTDGALEGRLGGEAFVLSKGGLLWAGPGTGYELNRRTGASLTVLRCRVRVRGNGGSAAIPWSWRLWRDGMGCLPWIEWLIQEADAPNAWSEYRLRSLIGGLFCELARMDSTPPDAGARLSAVQRRALETLLADRTDSRATPRELASAAGLTFDYFSRCFRRTYGRTPRRWLLERRIESAMLRLAETDLRVGEIARDLGYEDVFLFSRQFKAIAGVNPLAYRKTPFPLRPPVAFGASK